MEEAVIKRIMPHSLEAEQSVIGSMIMDRDAILTASDMLVKDDFYHQQYGILFETITELFNGGDAVDIVTLQNRLREKNVPPEISSLEYVGELVNAVPTSANVKYYAQIVQEKAVMRRLIKTNEEIANTCYLGNESLDVILEDTEKKIFQLLQTRMTSDYVPIKDVVLKALERIEQASRTQGTVTGIPTGFSDLDYKLSGLQPSDLILVAARPSMGKTALVLNIAQYVAFHEDMAHGYFQSGDVEGAVSEPSVFPGIPGGRPASPFRKSVGRRLGKAHRGSRDHREIPPDHRRYPGYIHIRAAQQMPEV